MQIRAVVTDIDGTIARDDGSVTVATLRASHELLAKGIPLIAATARTPTGLASLEPEMPSFAAAVCCNGSLGVDMQTGRLLWEQKLPAATCAKIVTVLTARLPDAGIAAFDGHGWTLTANYQAIRGGQPRGMARFAVTEALTAADVIALVVCHPHLHPELIARQLLDAGITAAEVSLTHAASNLLDIGPPGIDKAFGVARILEVLNIEPTTAVAFGDAPNDISMFKVVGHAVATANAHPDALMAAGSVTESVADDGFSHELTRLGLISPSSETVTAAGR